MLSESRVALRSNAERSYATVKTASAVTGSVSHIGLDTGVLMPGPPTPTSKILASIGFRPATNRNCSSFSMNPSMDPSIRPTLIRIDSTSREIAAFSLRSLRTSRRADPSIATIMARTATTVTAAAIREGA